MPTDAENSSQEAAARGEERHECHLRQQVEPYHIGESLVVDVNTGDYEIGRDYIEPTERLLAERPDAVLYALRVGYRSVGRIGGRYTPTRRLGKALQVHEAESHLREMLRLAGAGDVAPDAVKTWQVFQDFCRLPFSDPPVLLFACEQDDQSVSLCSRLYFERQMSVYHASAYSHMEHLTCTLCFPLMPGMHSLEDEEIVFEVGSDGLLENFIAEVEATNQFKALVGHSQPVTLTITQGKI